MISFDDMAMAGAIVAMVLVGVAVVTLPLNVSLDLGLARGTQHDLAAIDTDPCFVMCYDESQGPKALGRKVL